MVSEGVKFETSHKAKVASKISGIQRNLIYILLVLVWFMFYWLELTAVGMADNLRHENGWHRQGL